MTFLCQSCSFEGADVQDLVEHHHQEHPPKLMILVLFDGAGLARLGLERAGHTCVGVELDPCKHWLGQYVGSGNCMAEALGRRASNTAAADRCYL